MNKILKINSQEFEKIYAESRSKIEEIICSLDDRINSILFNKDYSLLFAGRFICNGYKVITENEGTSDDPETFFFNTNLIIKGLNIQDSQNFKTICQEFIAINYENLEEILSEVNEAQKQYHFYKNKV